MDDQTQLNSSPPDPAQVWATVHGERTATNYHASAQRTMDTSGAYQTSSPLSSAPPTPALKTSQSRRPSQPSTSPIQQHTASPRPSQIRRTSSAMSLGQRPTSAHSPKRVSKGSRSSFSAQPEEHSERLTPKRSISNLIVNLRGAQSVMESIEEPVPLTAAQIALDHFGKELMNHGQPYTTAETVVILHDACYGHRYSRLKTTKSTLSMIVERPERIHASVLGASAAYVRLGEHHAGARNAPHPATAHPSPPPFKIQRTARSMDITSSCVTNVHGTAWMTELRNMCNAAQDKLAAGAKELSRASSPSDIEKRKLHEGDLYLCPESLNAFEGALGGVADAVDTVFQLEPSPRRAFVAVRPPGHHCSADHPSGFCWLNNVQVGVEYAAQTYGLTHAAIIDFDLHHGDGSQSITWERNRKNYDKRWNAKPNSKLKLGPDIGYYSLHDINSYPCEAGDDEKVQAASLCIENAHGQSIWNVHLLPWKTESEFWQLYEDRYRVLLDKARLFLRHHTTRLRADGKVQPRAAIFISAGFDASEWEGAGMQRHKVNVPTEFYARFTQEVVQLAQEEGNACDGRVISVLEGGYSDRALCSGVLSHLSGLCAQPSDSLREGTGALDDMMNGLRINGTTAASPNHPLQYDRTWWSPANLTALEMKVNPPPPPAPGRKVRTGQQPTYATPTESFAYKVVDPNKFARSISGTMREVPMPAKPATPPPPEVDWVIATQELSKLLIPMDRQTKSCTPEELGNVRTKKDGQSATPLVSTAEDLKPRQLRDRKAKGSTTEYSENAQSDDLASLRSVSRSSNRRQTMHELPSASSDPVDAAAQPQRRASRRLSAGSTLGSLNGEPDADAPPVPALPLLSSTANGSMKPPTRMPAPAPSSAAGVMQIKKTRAPSKPRKDTALASASVSPVLSQHPNITQPTPAPVSGPATVAPGGDVETLTSSMKKINLKVGTRDEHDKKQEEKLAADRKARALKAAETRRVNAAAKKAAAQLQTAQVPMVPNPATGAQQMKAGYSAVMPSVASAPAQRPLMASPPENPSIGHGAGDERIVPTQAPSDPPTFPPVPHVEQQGPPIATAMVFPSFPDPMEVQPQPPVMITDPQQPPIQEGAARAQIHASDIAANISSPQPMLTSSLPSMRPSSNEQRKLPVFTSTGAIPFAAAMPGSPNGQKISQSSKLPKLPQSPPKNTWNHSRDQSENESRYRNGVSQARMGSIQDSAMVHHAPAPSAPPTSEIWKEDNIWDVPETPRQ